MNLDSTCCLSFAGDEFDHGITQYLGHHPRCEKLNLNLPTYHYKVNFYKILNFLSSQMFVRPEHLLDLAQEITQILEKAEGEKIYKERHT